MLQLPYLSCKVCPQLVQVCHHSELVRYCQENHVARLQQLRDTQACSNIECLKQNKQKHLSIKGETWKIPETAMFPTMCHPKCNWYCYLFSWIIPPLSNLKHIITSSCLFQLFQWMLLQESSLVAHSHWAQILSEASAEECMNEGCLSL